MCFNPAKSWKLGWYTNQYATFNGNVDSRTYTLNGVVNYNKNDSAKKVSVRVLSGGDADYYIGYNRAVGFNAGTREAANQVTIIQAKTSYAASKLVAKLGQNQKKTLVPNYKGPGRDLVAHFKSISQGKNAIVEVFVTGSAPSPTPNPTKQPTPRPTPQPTPAPTPQPNNGGCSGNRASFKMEVQLDEYGDLDNSWQLIRRNGNLQVKSRPSFAQRNKKYTDEVCLQKGQTYDFIMDDSYGDSLCCKYGQGYYKGYLNGKLIFSGGEGFKFKAKHSFST